MCTIPVNLIIPPMPQPTLTWQEVRNVVLARDKNCCRACGQLCNHGEADIHHLIPRSHGGTDEPANLVTLCDGCHAAHHPNLQATQRVTRLAGSSVPPCDRGIR